MQKSAFCVGLNNTFELRKRIAVNLGIIQHFFCVSSPKRNITMNTHNIRTSLELKSPFTEIQHFLIMIIRNFISKICVLVHCASEG